MNRRMAVFNTKGYITLKANKFGVKIARPIYDWNDGDVWKAFRDNKWDYNSSYDVMHRLGVSRNRLRIAPPTINANAVPQLALAAQAWPRWFDKVCTRLPGVRTAAMFGRRSVEPERRKGEDWQATFQRECIDEAPDWIADRAIRFRDSILRMHAKHSTEEFPQTKPCAYCGQVACWRSLTKSLYNGDPFVMKCTTAGGLKYMEPEFFRKGAGTWGDKPTW
jgi:predicted phosphoadenosine phosphosulfate sulfurtransferase